MAGMWEFPTVEVEGPGLFQDELPGGLGDRLEPAEELTTMRHGITKHRITVSVRRATCTDPGSQSARWLEAPELRELALTGMARKLAERLDAWESGLGA